MTQSRARLLSVLVALSASGIGYVLAGDPILALALVLVYGVSMLGYFVAVAQMTEAGTGHADSGTTVERRASVERSETDASR